jgi:hypothetical protein
LIAEYSAARFPDGEVTSAVWIHAFALERALFCGPARSPLATKLIDAGPQAATGLTRAVINSNALIAQFTGSQYLRFAMPSNLGTSEVGH